MTEEELRRDIEESILELEASMAKYAMFTQNAELIDRWEQARNEYLSLLTWVQRNL